MMLRICAWHRQSFGYVKIMGLARGPWQRTHGMCEACSALQRRRLGGVAEAPSVKKELARIAVALTAVAAYCLLALLVGGCDNGDLQRATERAEYYADMADRTSKFECAQTEWWRAKYNAICGRFYSDQPASPTVTAQPFPRKVLPLDKPEDRYLYRQCQEAWWAKP